MSIVKAMAQGMSNIRANKVSNEKYWNPALWSLAGAQSTAGVNVNESSALQYSAVWCAVNLIAGTVGTLPLHLIQQRGQVKRRAYEKPLYHLLHTQPNPYMTAAVFRETIAAHVITWGNGYAEIVRNGMGEVVELWPITPNRVQIDMADGKLFYWIHVDNQDIPMSYDRILHLHGLGFDGFTGYSVIAMARQSIGLGLAMEEFGSRFFGEGTHPGVVVQHPGKLSETAHKSLQADLTTKHSGLGKSHRLLLLEEGMKLESIGIPPEDAQFLQSRQFQIPEIARWFNLPPHKLRDLTKSSFNNIEAEQISFVTDSMLPWLARFEQSYNSQLLTKNQQKQQKLYFKHSVEGLLRGDAASRGDFYQKLWNVGAISINEIREKEDLPPVDGGDEYFVPLNMAPLKRALMEAENEDNEPVDVSATGEKLSD